MLKICNVYFWIENDPAPFETFPEIHPFLWRHPSLKMLVLMFVMRMRMFVLMAILITTMTMMLLLVKTFSTWAHLENGYNDSDDDYDGAENSC